MSGFKLLRTNHTSFTVSDLDRSIAFFCNALGFELTSKAPRNPEVVSKISGVEGADMLIAFVRGPGHSIELIQYLGPEQGRGKVQCRPCDVGFTHIAFDVDNIDNAIAACEPHEMRVIGEIAVIDAGPNAGGRVAYLRDTDGVSVEFIEKPEDRVQ